MPVFIAGLSTISTHPRMNTIKKKRAKHNGKTPEWDNISKHNDEPNLNPIEA